MKFNFDTEFVNDTAYYTTVSLKNFSAVNERVSAANNMGLLNAAFNESFIIAFSAPGTVDVGDIQIDSGKWMDFQKNIEVKEGGGGLKDYIITINYPDGETQKTNIEEVRISVNKVSDKDKWSDQLGTFGVAADELPDVTGDIVISMEGYNELGEPLNTAEVKLIFTRGETSVTYIPSEGENLPLSLKSGRWMVSVTSLSTEDGTWMADVLIDNDFFDVEIGKNFTLNVKFGQAFNYTIIDVDATTLRDFSFLNDEDIELSVKFSNNAYPTLKYVLHAGSKLRIERLPVQKGINASLSFRPVTINNVHYIFGGYYQELDGKHHSYNMDNELIVRPSDPVNGKFVRLSIETDEVIDNTFDFRFRNLDPSSSRRYKFTGITPVNSTQLLDVQFAPGEYEVVSNAILEDGQLFHIDATPEKLVLPASNDVVIFKLSLKITKGANIKVKGFPDFLSFGGCADMSPSNVKDLADARVSSLFKYSGNDGAGDAGEHLDPSKEPTGKIIAMAREVSTLLNDPLPVLPVMISYTCNLSLGNVEVIIKDPERHMFSFANFIQALSIAQSYKDDKNPVPAGFIVNPDYIGECQKYGFLPEKEIPVREPLAQALEYHKKDHVVPDYITDTLKGYVQAVNWLVRVIAPDVVLGWQVNLWGVAGSQWVYKDFEYAEVFNPEKLQFEKLLINPQLAGKLTAQYANLIGVFEDVEVGDNLIEGADFMAVDRYEADDFTQRSWSNGYCYSPHEWARLFDFCGALSRHLLQPVMPWQIPASHLPSTTDTVDDLPRISVSGNDYSISNTRAQSLMGFDEQNWGSCGSYIFGDEKIGSEVSNIHPTVLGLEFNSAHEQTMGRNARELFSRTSWDMSGPRYGDFLNRGIFHVQLGGGATTGVISVVGDKTSWVRTRLNKYRDNPIKIK